MFEHQKCSRKLHPHFLSLFVFMIIIAVAFSLFRPIPASAAIHLRTLSSDTTYPYKLTGQVLGQTARLTTNSSGKILAVWSNNPSLSWAISYDSNNAKLGDVEPNHTIAFAFSDVPEGSTYYQLFNEQGTPISNQVGISAGSDGTGSVFCDIDGKDHHGSCDKGTAPLSSLPNGDQNIIANCANPIDADPNGQICNSNANNDELT